MDERRGVFSFTTNNSYLLPQFCKYAVMLHEQKSLLQKLTKWMQSIISTSDMLPIKMVWNKGCFIAIAINLLAPEFYIQILAPPVWKNVNNTGTKKVALWNKRHFEEKNRRVCSMFKILSTYSCWKKIYKMQHLEGSGTPVLYTGRTVLNP